MKEIIDNSKPTSISNNQVHQAKSEMVQNRCFEGEVNEPIALTPMDNNKHLLIKGQSLMEFVNDLGDRIAVPKGSLRELEKQIMHDAFGTIHCQLLAFKCHQSRLITKMNPVNDLKTDLELVQKRLDAVSNSIS